MCYLGRSAGHRASARVTREANRLLLDCFVGVAEVSNLVVAGFDFRILGCENIVDGATGCFFKDLFVGGFDVVLAPFCLDQYDVGVAAVEFGPDVDPNAVRLRGDAAVVFGLLAVELDKGLQLSRHGGTLVANLFEQHFQLGVCNLFGRFVETVVGINVGSDQLLQFGKRFVGQIEPDFECHGFSLRDWVGLIVDVHLQWAGGKAKEVPVATPSCGTAVASLFINTLSTQNSLEKRRMSTTLTTSASSGIGAELARLFAAGGDDHVLVARSEEKLHKLASSPEAKHGVRATVMVADLSEHDAYERLVQRLCDDSFLVDHLVNNAGFGVLGDFASLPVDRQADMLQVNLVSPTMLTRLLLPEMILRRRGGILNVGSIAAYQAGPHMAVYYATRVYVMSFTEALREELIDTPLHVTLLAPGPTSTGFGEDSGMGDLEMFASGAMPVAEVAQAGYDGYRRNQEVVIPGWENRLMVTSTSFLPRIATRKLAGRLQNSSNRETT